MFVCEREPVYVSVGDSVYANMYICDFINVSPRVILSPGLAGAEAEGLWVWRTGGGRVRNGALEGVRREKPKF